MTVRNIDELTVQGFGYEWTRYDQSLVSDQELGECFAAYFSVFPWHIIGPDAVGFDVGCGSGRWAKFVAPRVGTLHCLDASGEALETARRNLAGIKNCQFHCASVDEMPFADGSMDFGYSLGVLHHIPDTQAALRTCVRKLKPGAPFLLYLYYALDTKPAFYRSLSKISDGMQGIVSSLPMRIRVAISEAMAASVYYPLARLSRVLECAGFNIESIPLSAYRNRSFYIMRTDAFDRYATRLVQRFSRVEIITMMEEAGLERITFRENGPPYWCVVGYRA